jgi:hypothetical protein
MEYGEKIKLSYEHELKKTLWTKKNFKKSC